MERYRDLSEKVSLTVGIYRNGSFYVLGDDGLSLRYDIGSISKTLTAHLILSLAERGLIALDKTVDHYIDLKKGNYPTVYELLTHTAGYHHLTPIEITLPSLILHGYARKNVYENCTSKTVKKCLSRRRYHKKSHPYGYSDFPYAILAVVAEQVTGEPFSALFEQFVHDKLGMKETFLHIDPDAREPKPVIGNCTVGFWKWKRQNPYISAGGLVSTVTDMLHYIELQIECGDSYITGAHCLCEASISPKSNVSMCIGWHTYKNSNQLWHVGGVSTFRSSVIINKPKKLGVVVLGNAKGVSSANVHYLAKMLYSELKMKRIDFTKYETRR